MSWEQQTELTFSLITVNMTAKVAIVVLLAIVGACTAAISYKDATEHPEYPGQCWEDGRAYRPGEKWPLQGLCAESSCYESSGSLYVSTESCGVIGIRPGCYKTSDSSKTYPDCCPKEKCQ